MPFQSKNSFFLSGEGLALSSDRSPSGRDTVSQHPTPRPQPSLRDPPCVPQNFSDMNAYVYGCQKFNSARFHRTTLCYNAMHKCAPVSVPVRPSVRLSHACSCGCCIEMTECIVMRSTPHGRPWDSNFPAPKILMKLVS